MTEHAIQDPLIDLYKKTKWPVAEIFGPTIQGEGYLAGRQTMFIRLAGCDGYDGKRNWCQWCDSMHAVDISNKSQWEWLDEYEILRRMEALSTVCRYVTISGGNPGMFDLTNLIDLLNNYYGIAIETQGTHWKQWMGKCDVITVSPKPPSAGADHKEGLAQFQRWLGDAGDALYEPPDPEHPPVICVKPVVDVIRKAGPDLAFAKGVNRLVRNWGLEYVYVCVYVSIVSVPEDNERGLISKWRTLIEAVKDDPEMQGVHIIPQLHVLLWGHRLGV